MKTILLCLLFFTLLSYSNEASLFSFVGSFLNKIFRADITEIIDCILHNDQIIYDFNKIIDALLTKDINKIVVAVSQVITELKTLITACINPELRSKKFS